MKKGFSLVEAILAIGMVACGILLVLALFSYMFKSSQKGVDVTIGATLGGKILDEYVLQNSQALRSLSVSSIGDMTGSVPVNGVTYNYTVDLTNNYSASDIGPVRMVSVTVDWLGEKKNVGGGEDEAKPAAFKSGYGMMSTTVSKIIYCK